MKNIYIKIFLLFAVILQLYLPGSLHAQCLCAGGVPAGIVTQSVTIPPTTTSNLVFNFQQFDPTVGTLSCMNFTNTVSGISYTGARNTGIGNDTTGGVMHIDSTAFLFSLSLNSKITGPGINVTRPFNTMYGYDNLKGIDTTTGTPGDTITYGPTDFISNPTTSVSLGGNAAYIGVGTVGFTYAINGGMITLDGGANYKSSVSTIIGGTIDLTYYYCPLALLASGLQNFSAHKKDNNIELKWDAKNAVETDLFDIEYSTDGKNFVSIGKITANNNSTVGSYTFNYALGAGTTGYAYFRIKQTGADNKPGFSPVQKINLNDRTTAGLSIYPNPAVTGITLNFDHPLNGDYSIELVNPAGQSVISKKVKLTGSSTIPLNWISKPAPGVYFTRVTNTSSMEQRIVRVVVQ
ncbi:MAG: T9SS type A sorting domain-containing protein [Bacteroidota bacterium]